MSFIDYEEGIFRIEVELVFEEGAMFWREEVVVIPDPEVSMGDGGTGEFIGADACLGAEFTSGIKCEGAGLEEGPGDDTETFPAFIEVF